jgi:hypothetical protein
LPIHCLLQSITGLLGQPEAKTQETNNQQQQFNNNNSTTIGRAEPTVCMEKLVGKPEQAPGNKTKNKRAPAEAQAH